MERDAPVCGFPTAQLVTYLTDLGISRTGLDSVWEKEVTGAMLSEFCEEDIKDVFVEFKDRFRVRKLLRDLADKPTARPQPSAAPRRAHNERGGDNSEKSSQPASQGYLSAAKHKVLSKDEVASAALLHLSSELDFSGAAAAAAALSRSASNAKTNPGGNRLQNVTTDTIDVDDDDDVEVKEERDESYSCKRRRLEEDNNSASSGSPKIPAAHSQSSYSCRQSSSHHPALGVGLSSFLSVPPPLISTFLNKSDFHPAFSNAHHLNAMRGVMTYSPDREQRASSGGGGGGAEDQALCLKKSPPQQQRTHSSSSGSLHHPRNDAASSGGSNLPRNDMASSSPGSHHPRNDSSSSGSHHHHHHPRNDTSSTTPSSSGSHHHHHHHHRNDTASPATQPSSTTPDYHLGPPGGGAGGGGGVGLLDASGGHLDLGSVLSMGQLATKYSAHEILSKKSQRSRPNGAQKLGSVLIRNAAQQAGLWMDPPHLRSISQPQRLQFLDSVYRVAPHVQEYQHLLWQRLSETLQNRRKYLLDKKLGKRGFSSASSSHHHHQQQQQHASSSSSSSAAAASSSSLLSSSSHCDFAGDLSEWQVTSMQSHLSTFGDDCQDDMNILKEMAAAHGYSQDTPIKREPVT